MGEAPAFFSDTLRGKISNDIALDAIGHQSFTSVGNKTYVIGGTDDEFSSTIGVQILDTLTNNWTTHSILGMLPKPAEGHSAVLLNEDRILVIDTPFVREQTREVRWFGRVGGFIG
ncbi:hypothetical protein Leryth_012233 [Lithospermum erythrorhizon]|nr:hypothetical protein Leryth_012233 [Lithospermum erythrorhizon]